MFTVMLSQNALLAGGGGHIVHGSVFAVWSPIPPPVLACSLLDTEGSKEETTKWWRRGGVCHELPVARLDLAIAPATGRDGRP